MRRSQMYKKVNRRNNVFNHLNRNVIYPNLFLSPDEINKHGSVEIVELKSDEELEKDDKSNYSHVWCYENDEQERRHKINREARERRRRRIEYEDNDIYNELFDRICTNIYEIDCHKSNDGTSGNNDTKCFTIINNHLSYETSSDDDFETLYSDTNLNDNGNNDKISFDDANYNNGNGEKRTVLLYTEKNKEITDVYDVENIPNMSTSSSTTDNDDLNRDINIGCMRRLATSIPTYIPKLYLPSSPTLPTVTEVLESHHKSSSNTDINQSKVMTPQMPINNWVQEDTVERENEKTLKLDNQTFVCDALSARERRRMKISMNIDKIPQETIIIDSQTKSANEDLKEKEVKTINYDYKTSSASSDLDLTNPNGIQLQKPHIKINTKIKRKSEIITEPLERENARWIGNDTNETMNVYDYNLDENDNVDETTSEMNVKNDIGVSNSFTTNMSLLKPMEWTQFLPITGSVPSLHLSLETDVEEKKSWLFRLFTCFECCKRNK